MSRLLKEKVSCIERMAPGIYRFRLESEHISTNAMPGQFVNIKCCEGINALLRRPISICSVDRSKNTFDIVFQVKGAGTEFLSKIPEESKIDLIGPLGNTFDLSGKYKRIAVVGGGIGVFPLLYLLQESNACFKAAFLGFRDKEFAVLIEEFDKFSHKLLVSSDNGSIGQKGYVTNMLNEDLMENKYDMIYACGPVPMLKEVVKAASKHEIKCQVSLEQRMGCGIGACLVCACKTKLGDGWEYSHVCKDGPVFWSEEIIFE